MQLLCMRRLPGWMWGLWEKNKLGGTCLHVGCIPAKELLETAAVYRTVSEAAEFGVTASEPQLDMAVVQKRKQGIIDKLTKGVEGMLKHRKVAVYSGVGNFWARPAALRKIAVSKTAVSKTAVRQTAMLAVRSTR